MLEIILVRHGETDSNIRGTYCGWTDPELNERGKTQARRAAELLKAEKLNAIYASPLKRAYGTAAIINRAHNIEIITDERLKEQNFGEWEDLTYAEIEEKYAEECIKWKNDWMNYCIKGGENPARVYGRVSDFMDTIAGAYKSGTIMVVTHLGCIRMILAHMLGMAMEGFWRFRVDNSGISRLVVNDGYAYLKALNL